MASAPGSSRDGVAATGPGVPLLGRRVALGRLAAIAGLPLVGGSCRREPTPPDVAVEPVEDDETVVHVPVPREEPVVRVRVARVRGASGTLAVGSVDQWVRVAAVADGAAGQVMRGPVSAGRRGKGWLVEDRLGLRPELPDAEAVEVTSVDPRVPTLALGERSFPGRIRLVARTREGEHAFDAVNHVALESYLPGVVARELFGHWHLEAHMAQAVAARSYACSEHALSAGRRHYDLTSTTRSQVYGGQVEHDRSIDAVALTRGAVLAFDRGVVPGYYSSCCGGVPARAVDAISEHPVNRMEPLRGRGHEVACREAPIFAWSMSLPRGPLSKGLSRWGEREGLDDVAALADIAAVEIVARNPHGRPVRYRVVDRRERSAELAASRLREAINAVATRSLSSQQRLHSSFVSVTVGRDDVTFSGHGFGHGVGMCQYGAEGRARAGQDHVQILEWYYPGAGVEKAYS